MLSLAAAQLRFDHGGRRNLLELEIGFNEAFHAVSYPFGKDPVRPCDMLIAQATEKRSVYRRVLSWLDIVGEDPRCSGEAAGQPALEALPERGLAELIEPPPVG